jgi:hypothetical protein
MSRSGVIVKINSLAFYDFVSATWSHAPAHDKNYADGVRDGLAHAEISSANSADFGICGVSPMSGTRTSAPDLLEPGTHVFTGTVRVWRNDYAELYTDSGVTIPLITQGLPALRDGARLTVVTRRYRPLYQVEEVREG